MKKTLIAMFWCLSGCVSFNAAYNDVNSLQIRRDSQSCIDLAKIYTDKFYFSGVEKSALYNLMGVCYSQIGFYDEAFRSFGAAVEISSDAESRSRALYQRAIVLFSIKDYDQSANKKYIDSGCQDIAESCRLMPEKYCNEYHLKKYPPTSCK
jgi:tetratricopeptide (TPR) repeat protein